MNTRKLATTKFEILTNCLPFVAEEDCFALHGGTAINMFIRNLPRLSEDIDLTFLPIQPWKDSLKAINDAFVRISDNIRQNTPYAVRHQIHHKSGAILKLGVKIDNVEVKIEVSPINRGAIHPPIHLSCQPKVEEQYGSIALNLLPSPVLYGGKAVAALSRQLSRDFFDVHQMLLHEPVDDKLRDAFVFYLACDYHPTHHVLNPRNKDLRQDCNENLNYLLEEHVPIDLLYQAKEELVSEMIGGMPDNHKEFLVSFLDSRPDWALLNIPNAEEFPAVRWKLHNLDRMDNEKKLEQLHGVESALDYSKAPEYPSPFETNNF